MDRDRKGRGRGRSEKKGRIGMIEQKCTNEIQYGSVWYCFIVGDSFLPQNCTFHSTYLLKIRLAFDLCLASF